MRGSFASRMTTAAVLLLLLTGGLYVAARQLGLFRMVEVGFGDSYIFYDVQHFQKTGEIYRDLTAPPYLPVQYGPLLYRMYALASRPASENPFIGPRLLALSTFFLSVAMAAVLVRALIPVRTAWLWGALMAISIKSLGNWPIQLRGDFAGISLSLAAIRLLLFRSRKALLAAGLCAGLAAQFKTTYVAAAVAGTLWLLYQRRWTHLAIFAAAGLSTSVGLFALLWLREPHMISQMLALAPGIKDFHGCISVFLRAIAEPVVLFAFPALPLIVSRRWPSWNLVLLYALVAFAIGGLTDIQAGGNINYFYEGLFAFIPLSVLGAFRLIHWSRHAAIAAFVIGLIVTQFWLPDARDLYGLRVQASPRTVRAINRQFRRTEEALRGRSIFSTAPRMALLDPHPALIEPYLLNYMQNLGKVDPKPLLDRIRSDEFDVVITRDVSDSWRGVSKVGADLGKAIVESYRPYCVLQLDEALYVFFPRNRPEDRILMEKLRDIDCAPYHRGGDALW